MKVGKENIEIQVRTYVAITKFKAIKSLDPMNMIQGQLGNLSKDHGENIKNEHIKYNSIPHCLFHAQVVHTEEGLQS